MQLYLYKNKEITMFLQVIPKHLPETWKSVQIIVSQSVKDDFMLDVQLN